MSNDSSKAGKPLQEISKKEAEQFHKEYKKALFCDCLPWWMENSLDREYGGYYSQLDRAGKPYTTEKYMWMNGRQVWMLSHLYNTFQPREEWLEAAGLGAEFMLKHAFLPDGKMHFRLRRDGQSRSRVLSFGTEVFAAMGLAEYSKASGDKKIWERAIRMYDFLMPRLEAGTHTPLLAYPLEDEFHLHQYDMCRIMVAWVFNQVQPQDRFNEILSLSVDSILKRHWKPGMKGLLENVAMDGSPMLNIIEGRMFHPGHAIETGWFLMEIALVRKDEELFATAIEIVLSSLEHGWDQEFGGIRYLTNIDWTPVHNLEADMKLWWPHLEALYALLLAWTHSGRKDLAIWYKMMHEYTFKHFPDPKYGEWFGYLNRDGSTLWTAKANGWKGCFHLPRSLYRCYKLLDRILTGF